MTSAAQILQYVIAAAVIVGVGFLVSGVLLKQPTPYSALSDSGTQQALLAPGQHGRSLHAAQPEMHMKTPGAAPAGMHMKLPSAAPAGIAPMQQGAAMITGLTGTPSNVGAAGSPGDFYREASNAPVGGKLEGAELPEMGAAYNFPDTTGKPILNDQSIDDKVQLFRPRDNGALFARQIGLDTSNEFRMQDSYDIAPGVMASLEGFDEVGLPLPLSIIDVENATLNELTVQSLKRNINKDIRGGIQVPMAAGCDDSQRGGFSHGISTIGRMAEAPVRARTRQEFQALNQYGINSVLAV